MKTSKLTRERPIGAGSRPAAILRLALAACSGVRVPGSLRAGYLEYPYAGVDESGGRCAEG